MARQFREQLEEEVQLEQARRAATGSGSAARPAAGPEAPGASPGVGASEPPPAHPDTFSHAHPTDATGADPAAVRPGADASADERGS